jgi:hypothetical protein
MFVVCVGVAAPEAGPEASVTPAHTATPTADAALRVVSDLEF